MARPVNGLLLSAMIGVASCLTGVASAQTVGKDLFTIDFATDAASLDPQTQSDSVSYGVYRNIFDNLLARGADGKIVPRVAGAWHYANDTTIDFDIRDDIRFHDGTPLRPEDVVFSIRRILDPKFASPQRINYDAIASVEASGPHQVTIKTKAPYAPLLAQLVNLSIIPQTYVEKVGDQRFAAEPIGSGPYKFKAWQKGARISLEANTSYWRGKPPFAEVSIRAVPDLATRIADLQSGRADFITQLQPEDADGIKGDKNLQVLSVPTERINFLFMNTLSGPTADVRVRRAIAYAVDRKTLIEALTENYGKPVQIDLAPPVFGYTTEVKGYDFDPAKARALIKEAGAVGAHIAFPMSPAYDRRLAEAIQQMLDDVGLKIDITMLDHPTFLRRRQGRPDEAGGLSLGRWSCGCQDADGVIYARYRSGTIWAKYHNPDFDRLVDSARSSIDPAARLADYKRAFEILREDLPGLGLFQGFEIYAARRQLRWTPTADEALFIFDMKWVP